MKILLVTIVDNNNIGTSLQIYATVKILESMGNEVVVLDYIRDYLFGRAYALYLWKDRAWIIRHLFAIYYSWINKHKEFSTKKFLKSKNVNFTKTYHSLQEIEKNDFNYDIFMTGSDQVWNTSHNNNHFDSVYFLSFANGKKVAFSSSIGTDMFPEEYVPSIKSYLSDYKHISVREKNAVGILNAIGVNNVQHVLDPTLLLSKEKWAGLVGENNRFSKTCPYLLIYSVEENRDNLVHRIASKVAEGLNLSIYEIVTAKRCLKKTKGVDRYFKNCSPELFIQLFANADFIVVSSFHGTAFSINFNKPFLSVAPDRFNSRTKCILSSLGLEDRYIDDNRGIPERGVDFTSANKKLDILRKDTETFLNNMLK